LLLTHAAVVDIVDIDEGLDILSAVKVLVHKESEKARYHDSWSTTIEALS
jgi:hypothetical protein